MRILHTSDWHLGRSFHRVDMLDAQSAYIDHLVEVVASEGADVVVVSGDIYDRALPPIDAIELANDALRRLVSSGVKVVMTSGNHDSAPRLGFAADLIDAAGVHLRTDPDRVGTPLLIPDGHGEVAIYGLPYLEPEVVRERWELPARSHQLVLDEAMARVRRDLGTRGSGTRSLVMAHAFVTGAAPSDSERDISVGGVANVGLSTFDGVDYVALGHLHGRHTLSERVRYSGSPLAYSFGEPGHVKGSWLVELSGQGLSSVEFVAAPVTRALISLRGTLDELLSGQQHTGHEDCFVHATLTDDRRPAHAMERLRTRFPHTLIVSFVPTITDATSGRDARSRVLGRTDSEVMENFFTDVRRSPPTADESALLQLAADACRHHEDLVSMRVHRLEITAFGPFPATEVIEFDELNESGFFLLTGPTGAGKTSVLDAICFGLFGAVPGVRNNARDLKSHHAGPRDRPVVQLEVTLRDRRFRFRRTPAWRRPSSRARAGYVDENASVQAAELVAGEWVSRGTRLDEVGLLVTRVLGMNKEQFCQVVMLPQGQFETFLRSGAKERHDVLEALFHTGRFQQIEKWLGEHRRRCDQASRQHEDQIHLLLARIEEVNGAPWLGEQPDPVEAVVALDRRIAALEPELDRLRIELGAATTLAKDREHAVSEGELLTTRQIAYAEARRQAHELDAVHAAIEQRERRIAMARMADKLTPLLALVDEAEQLHSESATAVDEALEQAVASGALSPQSAKPTAADRRAVALRARLAALSADIDIDDAIATARAELHQSQLALQAASAALAQAADSQAAIPHLLVSARAELARTAAEAARCEVLELRHRDTVAAHAAADELPEATSALEAARARERSAHDQHLDARSAHIDAREARIASMAAHLASELASDAACPVCGSLDHPHPAQIDTTHVTEADEVAAGESLRRAVEAHAHATAEVTDLERKVSELATKSGGIGRTLALAAVRAAEQALVDARSAAELAAELPAQISELERRLERAQATLVDRAHAKDALLLTIQHQQSAVEQLETRRAELLPDGGDVRALLDLTTRQLSDIGAWRAAHDHLAHATTSLTRQQGAFNQPLADSDFADVADLRAAALTPEAIASAEALNRSYAERRAITAERLSDPHLVEAAHALTPDLAGLQAAAAAARRDHDRAAEHFRVASRRHERLIELSEGLEAAIAGWQPLRVARDLATDVASMCAGTSPDNQTRTKLSHYVLAARLQQVVDAANIRLLSISSGRYQLLHTMLKGVGDARGGLGLRVLDTHTSQERDPATLSGGETFYVSLALALGLADLVRDEIGGTELSTLFVDEGFGSLDADTLDEVLDEIDALRTGGRCVGLVSHLSELRRRIPTQVRIVASPHGSKVSSPRTTGSPIWATSHD